MNREGGLPWRLGGGEMKFILTFSWGPKALAEFGARGRVSTDGHVELRDASRS
jgi:hypothetical protein